MKSLRQIIYDIRRGENIDLYITVIVSITLALLVILGLTPQSAIAPLTLAILALLSYSMLASRHQITRISEELNQSIDGVLLTEWPLDELRDRTQKSKDMFVIGPILLRAIKNNYALFDDKLQKGEHLRFLLVDPDSVSAEIIASRPYANVDIERAKNEIRASLGSLCSLAQSTQGKIEIRTIDYPLSFGAYLFDCETTRGIIFADFYPYKMRDGDRPKLVFRPRDGYWYEFFAQQAEVLWQNAKNSQC